LVRLRTLPARTGIFVDLSHDLVVVTRWVDDPDTMIARLRSQRRGSRAARAEYPQRESNSRYEVENLAC
jgi:hypothetical protein